MKCKHNKCAVSEEVKETPKTTCVIPQAKGPTIAINIKQETLARIQQINPELPINQLLEELIESFDW